MSIRYKKFTDILPSDQTVNLSTDHDSIKDGVKIANRLTATGGIASLCGG